jgi:hypothetical protein
MTFATHVAVFAATNSGIWFFRLVQNQSWPWTIWVTGGWAIALVAHGVYVFAIADYSEPTSSSAKPKGFG